MILLSLKRRNVASRGTPRTVARSGGRRRGRYAYCGWLLIDCLGRQSERSQQGQRVAFELVSTHREAVARPQLVNRKKRSGGHCACCQQRLSGSGVLRAGSPRPESPNDTMFGVDRHHRRGCSTDCGCRLHPGCSDLCCERSARLSRTDSECFNPDLGHTYKHRHNYNKYRSHVYATRSYPRIVMTACMLASDQLFSAVGTDPKRSVHALCSSRV